MSDSIRGWLSQMRTRLSPRGLDRLRFDRWNSTPADDDGFVSFLDRFSVLAGVFERQRHNLTLGVEVKGGVLAQGARFHHRPVTQGDQERGGVGKVLNLHEATLRSRKALCTVSPSGTRTTRRLRPSAWVTPSWRR